MVLHLILKKSKLANIFFDAKNMVIMLLAIAVIVLSEKISFLMFMKLQSLLKARMLLKLFMLWIKSKADELARQVV